MISLDGQLIAYVERYLLARDLSPQYASQLRTRTRKLCEWAARPLSPCDFSDELINSFLRSLDGVVSPRTIRGYRSNLLAIWNGCYDDRLTDKRPGRIRLPKMPEQVINAWDHGEITRLLVAAAETRGHFSFGPRKCLWWTAFIYVAYATTLRLGDVLRLRWSDVDEAGHLTLRQHKTGRLHTVALSPRDLAAVRAIGWAGPELLPWGISQDRFYAHFRKLCAAAGLAGTSKYLRRSGASYAELDRAGEGSRMLGHSSPKLFSQHYECRRITRPHVPRPRELPLQIASDKPLPPRP